MASRDQLKALIDQVPESRLEMIRQMLDHHVNPPPRPEVEQMQRRSREYKNMLEKRFGGTRKPGTIGGMVGGGSIGTHEGMSFGRQGSHYWDGKALVYQTLETFEGQEIEVMQRLSFSPDRGKLICSLEIASGGHTTRHADEFPATQAEPLP